MKAFLTALLIITCCRTIAQTQSSFTVHFDFDKYVITSKSAAQIDSFVAVIESKSTTVSVELYGHCDSVGSNDYNDALSQRRIDAVKKYLEEKGYQSSIVVKEKGFGKRQPINENATEYERYLNRRVVIAVLSTEMKIETTTVPSEKTFTKIMEDTATKVGCKIILKNLNFIGGRHYLVTQSAPVLEELLSVMNNNPKLQISIEGHVCCLADGSDGVDFDYGTANLSEMRAKTVYDYLIKNGIAPNRLAYKGFGHQFPLTPFPEKSEEERLNNRRVEVKIISK